MSLADNFAHRARFQQRIKTAILEIEDFRDEIMVSQQHKPPRSHLDPPGMG